MVEFECAECGSRLSATIDNESGIVYVDPCPECLDRAYTEGISVGQERVVEIRAGWRLKRSVD